MAAVIGSLRAVLSASIAEFTGDMNKAADGIGSFRKRFAAEAGKAAQASALLVSGAAAGLFALSSRAIGFADELNDAAGRIGFTVEQLQEVEVAAKRGGVEIEALRSSLEKFGKNTGEAIVGNKTMAASFASLGISVADLGSLSPHEIFLKTADAISRVEDPAQRLRLTLNLFGRSGAGLITVFRDGAKGIEDWAARARKLGLIISNEVAAKADKAADELDDMNAVLKMGGTIIGLSLMPVMRQLAATVTDGRFIAGVEAFAENMSKLIVIIAENKNKVLAVLGAFAGSRFGPLGALGGAVLGGAAGARLFESELDRIAAQIAEIEQKKKGVTEGTVDTFGQSQKGVLAALNKQLGVLEARKAFLEGPPDIVPAAKPGPSLTGRDGEAALEAQSDAFANAVKQIEKRIAVLKAQGGVEERTTFAIEKATAAANLRAAADAAGRRPTEALNAKIERLSDSYARLAVNADVEKIFDQGEKRLDDLRLENELVGMSAADIEARRFAEDQINRILEARGPLTADDRARIEEQTEAYRAQLINHEQRNIVLQRQVEIMDEIRDGLAGVLASGVDGFSSLKDAARGFLQRLADIAVELLIIRPLLENLFGAQGTSGGGILGSLFAGFFADGGTIPRGSFGIVGENGPEAVFAGAGPIGVSPNETLAGGGVPQVTLNIQTGVAQTVRAEIMNLLPQIVAASAAVVADRRQRGGGFSKAIAGR